MTGDRDLDTHLDVLAILSLVLGALLAVGGLAMALMMGGMMAAVTGSMGGLEAGMMGLAMLAVVASAGLLLAAGVGLRRRASWARTVGIAACALALFNVPVGTIFGIYGLWVLTRPGVEAALGGAGAHT